METTFWARSLDQAFTDSSTGLTASAGAGRPAVARSTCRSRSDPGPDGAAAEDAFSVVLNGEAVPIGRVVDLVNSAGVYLREDGYAGDCGADLPDDGRWSHARECFAVSGTALVTTASALARIGPLERSYFAYYEDADWCWRARLQGYRVLYDASSTIRHVRGQTSGGVLSARTRFLAERNRLLTLARCGPVGLAVREIQAQVARRGRRRRRWCASASAAGGTRTACTAPPALGAEEPGRVPPLGRCGHA